MREAHVKSRAALSSRSALAYRQLNNVREDLSEDSNVNRLFQNSFFHSYCKHNNKNRNGENAKDCNENHKKPSKASSRVKVAYKFNNSALPYPTVVIVMMMHHMQL
jgi:hypothetical protein